MLTMMFFNRVTSADRHAVRRSSDPVRARRLVLTWLVSCCVLIFLMVVLGGVTRLTGSGLSMVDWKPLSGVIPPLSGTAWQQEFENYQGSPQFQQVNASITLARFQVIFLLRIRSSPIRAHHWSRVYRAISIPVVGPSDSSFASAALAGGFYFGGDAGSTGLVYGSKWPC